MKIFFIAVFIFIGSGLIAQSKDSLIQKNSSVDYGNQFVLETNVAPFFPQIYSVDAGYRYWLRIINGKKDHTRDNTLSFSVGYLNIRNQSFADFKAGDLIGIRSRSITYYHYWRLGLLGEYIAGKRDNGFILHEHLGFRNGKFYLHAGMFEPIRITIEEDKLKPGFELGIDLFFGDRITCVN